MTVNMITNVAALEFLDVSRQALASDSGDVALDTLGWWDLLSHLDEEDTRTAMFSLFRAHGSELAQSLALGGLVALRYGEVIGHAPGTLVAALPRRTRGNGLVHVVVGEPGDRDLLVDIPTRGAFVIPASDATLHLIEVPGRLTMYQVAVPASGAPTLSSAAAAPLRAASTALGRVAIAMEILGAGEQLLAMATSYAHDRQQFGQPIGTFQAIRHLLAWAQADCVAIEAVAYQALRLGTRQPAGFDAIVKALAGRNGRRVGERTLQVFGGIGFTEEHDHHHFHSRILALDALLGSSAHLLVELGEAARADGARLNVPASVLF